MPTAWLNAGHLCALTHHIVLSSQGPLACDTFTLPAFHPFRAVLSVFSFAAVTSGTAQIMAANAQPLNSVF